VLENLISNAAKYSKDDAPIEVSLRTNESGSAEVLVRDHGIGLNESDLESVFTPFFRSDRAKTLAKGMGLGLAVCKRLIEAQNGRVWAVRRPEGGCDFFFTLSPEPEA
jgi:two-component system osmolarity sensor histidine kinase EnvZ